MAHLKRNQTLLALTQRAAKCDLTWQKFDHFGSSLGYLVFAEISFAIGKIFIVENGQILYKLTDYLITLYAII